MYVWKANNTSETFHLQLYQWYRVTKLEAQDIKASGTSQVQNIYRVTHVFPGPKDVKSGYVSKLHRAILFCNINDTATRQSTAICFHYANARKVHLS